MIPYLFQELFSDRGKDLVFLPHKIHLVLERRIKRNKSEIALGTGIDQMVKGKQDPQPFSGKNRPVYKDN